MNRAVYFAALWAFTAMVVVGLHTLQHAIGGQMPELRLWMMFAFGEWVALTPLIVRLARRFNPRRPLRAIVHIPLAASFAFLVLALHKAALCPADDYARCVTTWELQPWLYSWILSGSFIYAATTVGIWLLDSADAAKETAIAAAKLEQDLAAAELRLAQSHLRPETIAGAFDDIARQLKTDRRAAETMITTLADALREKTRAFDTRS